MLQPVNHYLVSSTDKLVIINPYHLLILFFSQKALNNNKITCLLKPITLSSLIRFYNCSTIIGLGCNFNF